MRVRPALATLALAASAVTASVAVSRQHGAADSAAAQIELGRRLFYDADLSIDGTMSCATCHEQRHGFTDGNATHPGVTGEPGRRNAPGLANVAARASLTWGDPRVRTLEAQSAIPLYGDHPVEMGMAGHEAAFAKRLGADACYRAQFRAAFPEAGGKIDPAHIARALGAFERSMISTSAPYDRYRAGDRNALPVDAKTGLRAFNAGGCADCHSGANLTDDRFHAIAPASANATDTGLAEITGLAVDVGKFRTPSLRNVAVSAPYLHNGSARSLADAIRRHTTAHKLSDATIASITLFLGSLTDPVFLKNPRLSLQPPGCPRRSLPGAASHADRRATRQG
ncbi:MAG: hypothetical protein BGO24_13775 [Sphingomonas sp. 67-36]|nr:MAG: hypothetical protein BGO24_13775 [Sphingomonas sp. 67-36]